MDGERFDDLIRRICTTRLTRISALRGLVAGTAAALTGATLAADETDAKKGGKGRKKSSRSKGKTKGRSQGKGKGRQVQREAAACAVASIVGGNPTCDDVNASGSFVKIDPTEPGDNKCVDVPVTSGGTSCTCRLCYTIDDQDLNLKSFTSTCLLKKVFLKSGNDAYVYDYTGCPGGGTTGDTNLTGDAQNAISHINFCGFECCVPETCESLGAECGAPDDGCGTPLDCGDCEECRDSFCDEEFQCACDPDVCPADTTVPVGRPCVFADGCCGRFRCPCDTECASGGAPNSTCTDQGICACDPDACPADTTVPPGGQCRFRDGCCGTYECPCDTDCPGGGANTTCTDRGICVCDPDECPADRTVPAGRPCVFRDGCCGRFRCPCSTECPGGGANNTCTDEGICVCTPIAKDVACAGKCGQVVDDGCCGTYTCPACCNSCTQGYYKQNQCTQDGGYSWGSAARPDDALSAICPGGSSIQAYCISKGYTTIGKALDAKGKDVICAQFAAAYLNQVLTRGEHEDCTTLGIGNICALPNNSASNATLSFWNEGGEQGFEICPNRGCGNS